MEELEKQILDLVRALAPHTTLDDESGRFADESRTNAGVHQLVKEAFQFGFIRAATWHASGHTDCMLREANTAVKELQNLYPCNKGTTDANSN